MIEQYIIQISQGHLILFVVEQYIIQISQGHLILIVVSLDICIYDNIKEIQ